MFFSFKKRISLVSTAIAMNRLTLLSHLTWLPWFRMNDFTCWKFINLDSEKSHRTACSVASFGTFVRRTLPYTAYRCIVFFFQQCSDSFFYRSNERMKKCKSVKLMCVFFSMFMLLKSQIKYVFSFIPNKSNSEVGSPMLFTIPY